VGFGLFLAETEQLEEGGLDFDWTDVGDLVKVLRVLGRGWCNYGFLNLFEG